MRVLPVLIRNRLARGIALALSLALCWACAPRALPASSASAPIDQVHDDPARDAHLSLLREAHKAFVQGRYTNAVVFFRRFVEVAPTSPRLAEARWWLGRSYEQLGEFRAAIHEYRQLAVGTGSDAEPPQGYRLHALHRLDELRQVPAVAPVAVPRQIAMEWPLARIPAVSDWVSWFQALYQAGVTVLVLDPSSSSATQGETLDQLRAVIGAAHVTGMAVWVVLDPHEGAGLAVQPEWASLAASSSPAPRRPDVAHPGYQEAVDAWAKALAQTGCDGVVLRARGGEGFAREYSDGAWQRFATTFGISLAPARLLAGEVAAGSEEDSLYWRWVGWKARAYVALVSRIHARLRDVNPTGRLVIEVHGTTMRQPLTGLEHYGEDVAELVQRTGAAIVVQQPGMGAVTVPDSLGQPTGKIDRWWLGVPLPSSELSTIPEWVGTTLAALPEQGPWNLLIRLPESARFP